jgi:uncharacterized membrane protein
MPEATKRRRRSRAAQPEDAVDTAQSTVGDQTDDVQESAQDLRGDEGGGGGNDRPTLVSELRDVVRDAAIEVLRPVAQNATKTAAKAVVSKGPDMVKGKVGGLVSDAGGTGELAKTALSKGGEAAGDLAGKLTGKDKEGKKPTGHGRGRRLPVQEYVDVAVSIDVAYDQYTQFEEFPKFMHRVEKVEQKDDSTLMWHENIWGVRRSWEAEIVEQTPCERIVWRSKGGPQVVGVVTFHKLSDRLTRVYVNMDFQPKGLFEKTASGFRMSRRALRSDLMRFKAFTEMRDEPTGAWRGLIEDGEVTEPEDVEGSEREDEERFTKASSEDEELEEAEEEPDEEEEEEEEPVAEDEEDWVDEDEDEETEEEPEERPAPRRRSRAKAKPKAASRRR